MRLSKLALGVTAAALVTAPIAAQADLARVAAPVSDASELGGDTFGDLDLAGVIVGLTALGLAVALILDDDDDDEPISV